MANAGGIVKNIIQTWKTHEVPPQWVAAQRSVVEKNPGWNYMLFSDEECESLVRRHFPALLDVYLAFPHAIQRADAMRCVALYVYGGVYLDLDYYALRSFDALTLRGDTGIGLISSHVTRDYVMNSFMVAKEPGHPFWLDCIEEMMKPTPWWAVGKHLTVFATTGPFMLHRVYKRNSTSVTLLNELATPCSACDFLRDQGEACRKDEALKPYFVTPVQGASWYAWDTKAINFVMCHSVGILVVSLVALAVAVAVVASVRSSKKQHKRATCGTKCMQSVTRMS